MITRPNTIALAAGVACAALLLALPPAADARAPKAGKAAQPEAPATLRVHLVEPAAEELPFGQGLDAVMTWVRARKEREAAPRLKKALDARERTAIQQRLEAELAVIAGSLVRFEGGRSGFEVGLLAGEFVPNANEALLRYKEGADNYYLFFTHDQLWKLARSLDPDEPFGERVARMSSDLGAGAEVVPGDGPDHPKLGRATWTGRRFDVALTDKRKLYSADLLVIQDHMLARRIEEYRAGRKPGVAGPTVDPDLDDFLEKPDEVEGSR